MSSGAESDAGVRGPLALSERLALRPREAAAALGLSERALRSLLPRLPHFREGSAVLIPVDALRLWLAERARAERESLAAIEAEFATRVRTARNR
jgi:hypothetical protein